MKIISARSFGIHIRAARLSKNWSQEKLVGEAKKVLRRKPICKQMLSKYERGECPAPSDKRSALCKALGIIETDLQEVPVEPIPVEIPKKLETHDVLPLLKKLANSSGLKNLTFEQFRNLCEADQRCKEVGVDLSGLLATETTSPAHQQ